MARRLSSLLPWDGARRSAALYAQSEDDIAAVLAIPFQRVPDAAAAPKTPLVPVAPSVTVPEQASAARSLRTVH